MSRLFDPVELMTQNVEANATKRDPLPVGEVVAQITEIKFTDGVSGPKSKTPGTPWNRLDLTMEITDPDYLAIIGDGREKAICFHGIMLDMNGGQIATGPNKNIRLGVLREATGTNGKPLGQMIGNWIRISIGHKPNPNNPDDLLHEVIGVTKV